MRRQAHALPLLVMAMGFACSPGSHAVDAEMEAVADRGIPVVEVTRRMLDQAPAWGLSRAPAVLVGGTDERAGYALSVPPAGVLLPSGGFALADERTAEVRIFDDSGTLVSTWGRHGSGPGELGAVSWVGLTPRGEVAAWDGGRARLTVFTSAGAVERTVRTDPSLTGRRGQGFLGFFADGSFPLEEHSLGSPIPRDRNIHEFMDTLRVRRFEADGSAGTRIFTGPGREWFVYRSGGGANMIPPIFGAEPLEAVAGSHLYVARTKEGIVWVVSTRGDTTAVWRLDLPVRRARGADVDSVRSRRLARLRIAAGVPGDVVQVALAKAAEAWRADPARGTVPVIDRVVAAQDGLLWVGAYGAPGDTIRTWYGLRESDGQPRFRLEMPAGVEVLDVDERRILARMTDEMDRPSVLLYRRAGPASRTGRR